MAALFKNNASSKLSVAITSGATSISVSSGEGIKFPAPTAGDWFPITLVKVSGALEILRCTARAGDVMTVTRAQEGTSAQAFAAGDRVELRLTAGTIDSMMTLIANAQQGADGSVKKAGDSMSGRLNLPSMTVGLGSGITGILDFRAIGGNASSDARIYVAPPDSSAAVNAGQLVVQAAKGVSFSGKIGAIGPIISDDSVAAKSGRAVMGEGAISLTAAAAAQNLVLSFVHSDATMRGQLYVDQSSILRYSMNFVEKFRVQGDGIVTSGNVYTANGAAHLNDSGNLVGPAWGGPLNVYLSNYFLQIGNLGATMASLGTGAIGSYALLVIGGGGNTHPGGTVAGGNTYYAAAGYIGTIWGQPPGIWRLMGAVANADGTGTDSITLCQRIS